MFGIKLQNIVAGAFALVLSVTCIGAAVVPAEALDSAPFTASQPISTSLTA